MAFSNLAPYLLLRFYKFATYLLGANLCKSIFFRPASYSRLTQKSHNLRIKLRLTTLANSAKKVGHRVVVKSFSGANCKDMEHYLNPTLDR